MPYKDPNDPRKLASKKKTREKYKEKNAEYYKKYRETHPYKYDSEKRKAYMHREDNVIKVKARKSVQSAVQNGNLIKPDSCSSCGMPGKIEAHHTDYSKPLDVTWMCRPCHLASHS